MPKELWQLLALYLAVVNLAGFALMGIDKWKAKRGAWRISEKTLFLPAVLGGCVGCILGMRTFRHKTKHCISALVCPPFWWCRFCWWAGWCGGFVSGKQSNRI